MYSNTYYTDTSKNMIKKGKATVETLPISPPNKTRMEKMKTMCKEVTTKCICDRCKKTIEVAPKKIAGVYRAGKYPDNWTEINDFNFCEKCTNDYNQAFNQFMKQGNKKK